MAAVHAAGVCVAAAIWCARSSSARGQKRVPGTADIVPDSGDVVARDFPLHQPAGAVYSSEFDPTCRGSSPCTTAVPPPPAASHHSPSAGGGLSCLFSSPAAAAAPPRAPAHDDLGALWHDRSDDLSVAGGYSSHSSSPLKRRDLHHRHSPVSVFQGPSSSSPSRSPPASWLTARDRDRLFAGFMRNALGSCVDYAPPTSPRSELGAGELAFELDENLADAGPACEPYARELLASAQDRHRIFHEEVVVKAFLEAEKAHRGQEICPCVATGGTV